MIGRAVILLWFLAPICGNQSQAVQQSASPGPWHAVEASWVNWGDSLPADSLLAVAEAALEVGYGERASQIWERIDTNQADPMAYLQLGGEIQYSLGNFAAAASLFSEAAGLASEGQRAVLLTRVAVAHERERNVERAAESYSAAAAVLALPSLKRWLALREASVTPDIGRAFSLLRRPPPPAERRSKSVRAVLLTRIGDYGRADSVYRSAGLYARAAALAATQNDSTRARTLILLGLKSLDDSTRAASIRFAEESLAPQTAEDFAALGGALAHAGENARAVGYLELATESGDSSAGTLFLLGSVRQRLQRNAAAATAYAAAARDSGISGRRARFHRGRLLLRSGRFDSAINLLSEFADSFPNSPLASRAVYAVADWLERRGRVPEADSAFSKVVDRWPASWYASQARRRLAEIALIGADTLLARAWYEEELQQHPGAPEVIYELARLHQHQGDSALATRRWRELARSDSLGYYGLLARQLLSAKLSIAPAPEVAHRSERVRSALVQLDFLDESYLETEADELVQYMAQAAGLDGEELLELSEGLVLRGRASEAISAGWSAAAALTLNDPRVLRAVFPWPFRELIEREAAKQNLDRYLVAAIIRQESHFAQDATSRAGARGLMQLMPATAREVARRAGVGWNERLLAVPDANVHVGTLHFSGLLRRFDGDVVLALAAYNAGAGNLARWRRRISRAYDPVEFIESIPFEETRGYIKTVLRNRDLYGALYPPRTELQPGDESGS